MKKPMPKNRLVDVLPGRLAAGDENGARLQHGPYCALPQRTGSLVILVVEDNLVKGSAGQAVQAMNLVKGLPETEGLEQIALVP